MIDSPRGGQIAAFEIGGWITDATALGPLFVAFDAGEGTGEGGTSGAAVSVRVDMAGRRLLRCAQ